MAGLSSVLFFAGRVLAGRSREAGGRNYLRGALLGMALSLVPLVLVMVVSDGMIQGITARYLETGTYHLQARDFFSADAATLRAGAERLSAAGFRAFPEIQGGAMATRLGRTEACLLRAVDPVFFADPDTAAYLQRVAGEPGPAGPGEVILGLRLAESLDAGPGDLVSLVSPRLGPGSAGGGPALPRVRALRVRAVVTTGYRELDARWAFLGLSAASRILDPESSRAFVGLKVEDPFDGLESARERATAALAGAESPASFLPWSVSTWEELERNLFKSFTSTRSLLLLIMALAVAVAAVNVSSALVMLVLERRKDIALLLAAGVPGRRIGFAFLLAGTAAGGLGSLLGLGLGALLSWRINELIALAEGAVNLAAALLGGQGGFKLLDPGYYLERIPVRLDPRRLALILAIATTLSALASVLPARRATRLSPMETLRRT